MNREDEMTVRRAIELERLDRVIPSPAVYTPPVPVVPTITGSRGGNAALASLLTALDAAGIVDDQTTA